MGNNRKLQKLQRTKVIGSHFKSKIKEKPKKKIIIIIT